MASDMAAVFGRSPPLSNMSPILLPVVSLVRTPPAHCYAAMVTEIVQWLQWLQWGVTFSQVVWLIGC